MNIPAWLVTAAAIVLLFVGLLVIVWNVLLELIEFLMELFNGK
jgi:hypothetical protein